MNELINVLNSNLELVAYVLRTKNWNYPRDKMKVYDECCRIKETRLDPELIFRSCRKINERNRTKNLFSNEKEQTHREYWVKQ